MAALHSVPGQPLETIKTDVDAEEVDVSGGDSILSNTS